MSTRSRSFSDLIFGIVALLIGIVMWWESNKLPPSPYDPLGPGAFPKLVSGALAVLSAVLLTRVALGLRVGQSETSLVFGVNDSATEHRRRPALAIAFALVTALYVALLQYSPFDFVWLTVIYIFALGFALSQRSRSEFIKAIAVALFLGIGITFLFAEVLIVDLP